MALSKTLRKILIKSYKQKTAIKKKMHHHYHYHAFGQSISTKQIKANPHNPLVFPSCLKIKRLEAEAQM